MKYARIKSVVVCAAILGLQTGARAAEITYQQAEDLRRGVAEVKSELDAILRQAESGGGTGGSVNDALAKAVCAATSDELATAEKDALSAAQLLAMSPPNVTEASSHLWDACLGTTISSAGIKAAAEYAAKPPPGRYTPFQASLKALEEKLDRLTHEKCV